MQTTYSSDQRQLVEATTISFFESMLQMAVWPIDDCGSWQSAELCTARVSMLCDPTIEVYLHLTESQAFDFTERLMQIPRPTLMNDDVLDTMREIVNVIGGNLKASLAQGQQLSIAQVLNHCPARVSHDTTEIYAFESGAGIFWIALAGSESVSQAISQEEALLAS